MVTVALEMHIITQGGVCLQAAGARRPQPCPRAPCHCVSLLLTDNRRFGGSVLGMSGLWVGLGPWAGWDVPHHSCGQKKLNDPQTLVPVPHSRGGSSN